MGIVGGREIVDYRAKADHAWLVNQASEISSLGRSRYALEWRLMVESYSRLDVTVLDRASAGYTIAWLPC